MLAEAERAEGPLEFQLRHVQGGMLRLTLEDWNHESHRGWDCRRADSIVFADPPLQKT